MKHIRYFLPFILAIAFLLWLTSCVTTEKQRAKICASCPVTTIVKDSITEKITAFDTTLFITQNGNSISLPYLKYPLQLVDSLNRLLALHNGTITTNNKGIVTSIIKTNGRITFNCKADSLEYLLRIERQKVETTRAKTIVIEKPKVCPECSKEHRTGYDHFLRWLFIILGCWFLLKNLPGMLKALITGIKTFR